MTWPYALLVLGLAQVLVGGVAAWRGGTSMVVNDRQTLTSQNAKAPAELHALFEKDFAPESSGSVGTILNGYSLVPLSDGKDLRLEWRVVISFGSHSRFMVYYIPESPLPAFDAAKFIAQNYKGQLESFTAEIRTSQSDTATNSSTLPFTGKIFVYHEQDISDGQKAQLIQIYKDHGLVPEFRSRSYPLRIFDAEQIARLRSGDAK